MADLKEPDTALCIIPPRHLWPQIDRVRSLHDRNFPNWPPHIKLMYPFVPVQTFSLHLESISKAVQHLGPIPVRLKTPDLYNEDERRQAIFLHVDDAEHVDEDGGRKFPLDRLCKTVIEAVERLEKSTGAGAWYRSMTVGHSLVGESADGAQSLLLRAGLLSGIGWEVDELHVLIREGLTSEPRPEGSRMIDWATISLRDGGLRVHQKRDARLRFCTLDNKAVAGHVEIPGVRKFYNDPTSQTAKTYSPYCYDGVEWSHRTPDPSQQRTLSAAQRTLTVASINVLGRTDKFLMLIQNVLHSDAEADVLVLQEATGVLLSQILHDRRIQEKYTFCTHRPIDETDCCDALPNQKMVVVLSRYAFDWEIIPLPLLESEPEPACPREHEKDVSGHEDISDQIKNERTLVKSSADGYGTRTHDRALLVEFRISKDSTNPFKPPAPLALAAFHLTPGWNQEAYQAKALELDAIKHYIFTGTPAILAGGFNMPTSAFTLCNSDFGEDLRHVEQGLLSGGYIDTWMITKIDSGAETDNDPVLRIFQGEQGCTDGVISPGPVADHFDFGHDQLGRRPQRLDRILVKPHNLLMVQSFNRFGKIARLQEDEPSDNLGTSGSSEPCSPDSLDTQPRTKATLDTLRKRREAVAHDTSHWGVRAVLKLGRHSLYSLGNVNGADNSGQSAASYFNKGLSPHLREHGSLLKALRDADGFPLLRECRLREKAFELLKDVLLGSSSKRASSEPGDHNVDLVILPVGSYGLGVWTSLSDLDCLCVGSFSFPTFIDLARQRVRQAANRGIKLIGKNKTYAGTKLALDMRIREDVLRIDLTYARTAWPLPSSNPTESLSNDTLSALKAYRDLDYVQRSVPDIVAFRLAHRFVKMWAVSRGIYSAKFGYLDGIQITVLLTRVHKLLTSKVASPTVPEILFSFFREYASFDWGKGVVLDEFFHKDLHYSKTSREPLAILGYFPPALNTSLRATASSVWTIASEFQRARSILDRKDVSWADLLMVSTPGHRQPRSLAADEFLKCHHFYVKIHAQYWGGLTIRGRRYIGWVESRCVSLVADLEKRLTKARIRIWPASWTQGPTYEENGEHQCFYIVGLDWTVKTSFRKKCAEKEILVSFLVMLERQVRRDARHFDAKSMGFSAEFMDVNDFINTAGGNDPSPSSSHSRPFEECQVDDRNWDADLRADTDPEDEGQNQGLGQAVTVQDEWYASSKKKRKPATNQPRSVVVPKPEGAGKFRTATDVLNRLRWDASYDQSDFVVGFEDRFLGAMERGLDLWKSEQTDEEFIPQHRILYFRRSSDGVVVWERRTRTDLVFGSG